MIELDVTVVRYFIMRITYEEKQNLELIAQNNHCLRKADGWAALFCYINLLTSFKGGKL